MTNMLQRFPNTSEDIYWILPHLADDEGENETMRNSLFTQAYLQQRGSKQHLPKNRNFNTKMRIKFEH